MPTLWDESKHPRDELGEFAAAPKTKQETGMQVTPGPVAQQPRQTLMFDTNKTLKLFDTAIFEAAKKVKKTAKPSQGPSLLERIEDDLAKQADESKPLGGQKEMFARVKPARGQKTLSGSQHWITIGGYSRRGDVERLTKRFELAVAQYAKPNKGQRSLDWEEDEHPRNDLGEFTFKDDIAKPTAADKKSDVGPAGLTKQQAINKAMEGSSRKVASYDQACKATYLYTGTTPHDWKAVAITGVREIDIGGGKMRSMPEFEFPVGYAPIETPHGGDHCCQLCGHDIKYAYHLQNDDAKTTMTVGSECVTNFTEGKSGEKLAKEAKYQADRDFVGEAQAMIEKVKEWHCKVNHNYGGSSFRSAVYKMPSVEARKAAFSLARSLGATQDMFLYTADWMNLTDEDAEQHRKRGYASAQKATNIKVANWVKKYGDKARGWMETIDTMLLGAARAEKYARRIERAVARYSSVEWVRAPKGGAISPVNQQHYDGGEFMPIHGKSEKKAGDKSKKKPAFRPSKAIHVSGEYREVPEGHQAISSMVGGHPQKSHLLPDHAFDYLRLTRKQADQLKEIFEAGDHAIPREIIKYGDPEYDFKQALDEWRKSEKKKYARRFDQAIARYYRNRALRSAIATAAAETEQAPSPEQKEAGNYRKGKFNWRGLTIAIENPVGSIRRGKSKSGQSWEVEMKTHYGYILRNVSEADGDHVDVFVGPHPESDLVCVVDQRTPGGHFDEHKVMIGFTCVRDAKKAYLENYSPGWTGLESITAMTTHQFKEWLKRGDSGRRLAKQVSRYTRIFEQSVERYAQANRAPSGKPSAGGHWVTVNGAHVFIKGGKATKGPKALTGTKPTAPATATSATAPTKPTGPVAATPGRKPNVPTAYAYPVTQNNPSKWSAEKRASDDVEIPDDIHFKEWVEEEEQNPEAPLPPEGKSRKAAIVEAATKAAEHHGLPVKDVLLNMPQAHRYLKSEQADRETAKAALRKVSGLNARSLADLENKYQDHSSVPHWDTTAREFAMNYPALGYDPDGDDTPAQVWEFLREGKAPYIAAHHQEVAELAAEWAKPAPTPERDAGDEDDLYESTDLYPRGGESVPFSRRGLYAARVFDRYCRRASTTCRRTIFLNREKISLSGLDSVLKTR